MKILLIILPCFFLAQTCLFQNTKNEPTENGSLQPEKKEIDFEKEVKPIFVKNCSPCHFTGGKMYEKLPFDKDTTIINHGASILKRIKNEEENLILRNFVSQYKNGLPENKP